MKCIRVINLMLLTLQSACNIKQQQFNDIFSLSIREEQSELVNFECDFQFCLWHILKKNSATFIPRDQSLSCQNCAIQILTSRNCGLHLSNSLKNSVKITWNYTFDFLGLQNFSRPFENQISSRIEANHNPFRC